jgi:HEAT repeat protein
MNARDVIDLLEGTTDDRRPIKARITAEASLEAIVSAMREAKVPLTRQILCDIVGARHAVEAVPELLATLDDTSPSVRSAAADALAAIRDPTSGPALLTHYRSESQPGVRTMLAVALGAVGYRPAIPDLIRALNDPDTALQMESAWSLGELRATEARQQIARALSLQTDDWARKLMADALAKLDA